MDFNSAKFWALLAIEFSIVVVWQGGMQIDLTNFVVAYFNSDYRVLRFIKFQILAVLGEIPDEIADRASLYTYETAPPDIQIAMIRSRAMVVQETWMGNDIKMASEFQSIACAVTAVAADILWKHIGVGKDMIQGTSQYKKGLLSIYFVNLMTLLLGQAIARKQLHSKVSYKQYLSSLYKILHGLKMLLRPCTVSFYTQSGCAVEERHGDKREKFD